MKYSRMKEKIREAELDLAVLSTEEKLERLLGLARQFLKAKRNAGQISMAKASDEEAFSLVLSWKGEALSPLGAECLEWVITGDVQAV
ncbi:MAG: hypothetical protein JRI95_15605 [Deltaproteobacteria bacterium]|nr:hypothetical protein [Deltaproteobacteria bacterium]